MSRLFRHLPIRHKLIAMIMTASTAVLLLASLGYLISDAYQTRRALEIDLESQAGLVLQHSSAALQFDDANTARETLATLETKPNIRMACLYRVSGQLFAAYSRGAGACPPDAPAEMGPRMTDGHLDFAATGEMAGAPYGAILLRSDLEALARRRQFQLVVVAFLLVIALGVAVLLSARLQAIVSEPVTALAATAGDVSKHGDYSIRATRTTDDELGVLVDEFNRMLERIEQREADLSKANEELRREIAERRRAEQQRGELLVREREANRLKDEFLATLSHELRTPLNAILGWTKLLRAHAVPEPSIDRALEKVERNAQVQARLIEDLLDVSRIVTGKLGLEFRSIDLVALCTTAVESIRPAAEARGLAVVRESPVPSLPTAGDPDRLQQVVWNLLSNAVKFTPPGGSVGLSLRRDGDADEITVSDTGIGIDPAFLPNVFDTFRQGDASSTRTHGGLGLGLSIVKQLVEMHGGEVRASSPGLERGATFVVRLPVRAAARRRSGDEVLAPPGALDGRLAGRDILVVDDDPDTRELLVSVLERAGGRVRAAQSAAEGLAFSLEEPPEAVVSDIAMPGEDGHSFIARLEEALGPRMPRVRVALSAFAGVRDRDRSLEAGFQRHVVKPVDPAALVQLLEELLADGDAG